MYLLCGSYNYDSTSIRLQFDRAKLNGSCNHAALGETKKSEILAENEKSSITKTWRDAAL